MRPPLINWPPPQLDQKNRLRGLGPTFGAHSGTGAKVVAATDALAESLSPRALALAPTSAKPPRGRQKGDTAPFSCAFVCTNAQKELRQSGRDGDFFERFFGRFCGFAILSCANGCTNAHGQPCMRARMSRAPGGPSRGRGDGERAVPEHARECPILAKSRAAAGRGWMCPNVHRCSRMFTPRAQVRNEPKPAPPVAWASRPSDARCARWGSAPRATKRAKNQGVSSFARQECSGGTSNPRRERERATMCRNLPEPAGTCRNLPECAGMCHRGEKCGTNPRPPRPPLRRRSLRRSDGSPSPGLCHEGRGVVRV
jgi:hypothetical protein